MHRNEVRGIGKGPGLRAREPDIEEVRAVIRRTVAVLDRAKSRGLSSPPDSLVRREASRGISPA